MLAGILVIAGFGALVSCAQDSYPVPVFQNAPEVIELEKMLADYQADPAGAAARYQGETFLFPAVEAEKVVSQYLNSRAYAHELHMQNGFVRFRPRDVQSLDPIGPGFVVDVVGDVRGWIQGYFYVDNCSYNIVEGGDLPPPMGY